MELNSIISNIYKEILSIENKGDLANYIPELANVNPEKFINLQKQDLKNMIDQKVLLIIAEADSI